MASYMDIRRRGINKDTLECLVNFRNINGQIVLTFTQKIIFLRFKDTDKNSYIEYISSKFGNQIRFLSHGCGIAPEMFSDYYKIISDLNDSIINILNKDESNQSIEHMISKKLKTYILLDETPITLDFTLLNISNNNLLTLNLCKLNNKEEVLEIIHDYRFLFNFLRKELQREQDIVLLALESCPIATFYNNPCCICYYVPKDLLEDKEFVLSAAKKNAYILQHVKEEYKADKEIVLAAMSGRYLEKAFAYASKDILNDKNFLIAAVKQNHKVLHYLPKQFKHDFYINRLAYTSLLSKKLPSVYNRCCPIKKLRL